MAKPMSLESVLDEERRDVLALLEASPERKRRSASSVGSGRASSPRTKSQPSVRSMLDIDDDVSSFMVRHASIAGTNNGMSTAPRSPPMRSKLDMANTTPTTQTPIRSMLDITSKSSSRPSSRSAQTSPTETTHKTIATSTIHPRSQSDASSRPASFGPRSASGAKELAYQFSGYLPSSLGGPVMPKRNTQTGKKSSLPSAMAEVVRSGGDLPGLSALLGGSKDRGRNNSLSRTGGGGINGTKSKSPHNRFSLRSASPHVSSEPNKFELDDGRVIDMNNAYRKLSDANLANSQGGLSKLPPKSRRRTNSDGIGPHNERLEKDYGSIDGEDAVADSSDEDDSDPDNPRGRKKLGRADTTGDEPESSTVRMGKTGGPKTSKSLLGAVDDERQEVAALQEKYKVRSLIDPEITVTSPSGDRLLKNSKSVHPNTSFDEGGSGFNTPVDSDTEADITDIKRAQRLQLHLTNIVSTPSTSRCVRTIYRGDFSKMQQEAADNQRRVRKYLVATDLSEEAAHALEWTIGTVLRDGDTLLAIYCVDEEIGIAASEGSADDQMKEQVAAVASSASSLKLATPILGPTLVPSPLGRIDAHTGSISSISATPSPAGSRNKAETERYRAVQHITDMVSKLLRKTKLQVKVVIEVIHCKSPKHLITEVIDYINPTLVILGSRGRSALKGVILGSFSNYLVTKSSVPVMVARKRLKKHTKYKRPPIKLTNNLTNPAIRSLVDAKID